VPAALKPAADLRSILQGAETSLRIPTVLAVPLTTQKDALRFPGTVLVEPDKDNGLRHPSVALVFQLTAIDRKFLSTRIGQASETTLTAIRAAFDALAE
jgi:mRNA-degrading endonuclease toxin of MazEF toxin-antitoxin module